jgi:lipoate-protein ligase A
MQWQILDTGVASAKSNMAVDYALLKGMLSTSAPILHLYEWEGDCATHGYFQDPFSILNKDAVAALKLNVARRPTGGGLLFHLTDFAFSVLIPASHPDFSLNTLRNYAYVNQFLAGVIEKLTNRKTELYNPKNFYNKVRCCMADLSPFDVMIEGKKVAGGAQRRNKHGFLHQGSVSFALLPEFFFSEIFQNSELAMRIKENTYGIVNAFTCCPKLSEIKLEFKRLLFDEIQKI